MEFLFDKTQLGQVTVTSETIADLVTRQLPEGVTCLSIRYRTHDKLCLVLISDRRPRWDSQQDNRQAHHIVEELKELGIERPRLQWIRATTEQELRELKLRRASVVRRPLFWAFVSALVLNLLFMPFKKSLLACLLELGAWKLSHWLLREEGLVKVKDLLPESIRSWMK